LPDAQVGVPYSMTITAAGGNAPYDLAVTQGVLPAGLSLSPSGELTGTPVGPGVAVFTVSAVDAFDCVGSEVYTLPVFTDPAISRIVARTEGLCLSANRTCVSVPFVYERGDTVSTLGAHVTFQLDPRFTLCTPGAPSSSIHFGTWLSAYANHTFQVIDNGGGSYTVDQALLGAPCGPDSGGVLFTVDVATVAGDGSGDITVTECRVKDCNNLPLPAQPGPPAQLVVSQTPPPAITDLASAQVLGGNGTNGRTDIALSWTNPLPGSVALYRAPFGSYPEYDDLGGAAPDSALAPAAPWTLVSAAAVPGVVDVPPVRGSWHYVAFLTDSCGNRSAVSNRTRGALDYHLGDVSNSSVRGAGNNRVGVEDVSLLGAHYGISGATLVSDSVAYLDVGPTIDGLPTSRPTTDDLIDFEDLILFSLNFQIVSTPQASVAPAPGGSSSKAIVESFELEAPPVVQAGDEIRAVLKLNASGRMQGFSAELAWDAGVLEPVGQESGGFAESQGGVLLSPRPGVADAALLGVRGSGLSGAGEVANFRFRVKREGDTGLKLKRVLARDAANHALAPDGLASSVLAAVPARTLLLSPAPNPARGATQLAFALAKPGAAELAIYSVDGRRVRTLAHGARDAGAYHLTWKGEDEGGRTQAPGVYWARLQADGQTFTRRIVFLK
ncbi:MAG: putative Ig domain-containing protein, partial [Candidatus Eisenbacteria bacterium]